MITNYLNDEKIFCYIVCGDVGRYMQTDIKIKKVFLDFIAAKKYIKNHKYDTSLFIIKKRLFI